MARHPGALSALRLGAWAGFAAGVALSAGCSRNAGPPGPVAARAEAPEGAPTAAPPAGGVRSAAGASWEQPVSWQVAPERSMRIVTYRIPALQGDPEDAECGVFFFGAGQGGNVEMNVSRWLSQFVQPDGRATEEVARQATRTLNGLAVTTVDVSGTFLFSPTPMSPDKTPKPGFRMLGAIVEAPEGNVFFKLTGPAATVAEAAAAFESLLHSLRRQ